MTTQHPLLSVLVLPFELSLLLSISCVGAFWVDFCAAGFVSSTGFFAAGFFSGALELLTSLLDSGVSEVSLVLSVDSVSLALLLDLDLLPDLLALELSSLLADSLALSDSDSSSDSS